MTFESDRCYRYDTYYTKWYLEEMEDGETIRDVMPLASHKKMGKNA